MKWAPGAQHPTAASWCTSGTSGTPCPAAEQAARTHDLRAAKLHTKHTLSASCQAGTHCPAVLCLTRGRAPPGPFHPGCSCRCGTAPWPRCGCAPPLPGEGPPQLWPPVEQGGGAGVKTRLERAASRCTAAGCWVRQRWRPRQQPAALPAHPSTLPPTHLQRLVGLPSDGRLALNGLAGRVLQQENRQRWWVYVAGAQRQGRRRAPARPP